MRVASTFRDLAGECTNFHHVYIPGEIALSNRELCDRSAFGEPRQAGERPNTSRSAVRQEERELGETSAIFAQKCPDGCRGRPDPNRRSDHDQIVRRQIVHEWCDLGGTIAHRVSARAQIPEPAAARPRLFQGLNVALRPFGLELTPECDGDTLRISTPRKVDDQNSGIGHADLLPTLSRRHAPRHRRLPSAGCDAPPRIPRREAAKDALEHDPFFPLTPAG